MADQSTPDRKRPTRRSQSKGKNTPAGTALPQSPQDGEAQLASRGSNASAHAPPYQSPQHRSSPTPPASSPSPLGSSGAANRRSFRNPYSAGAPSSESSQNAMSNLQSLIQDMRSPNSGNNASGGARMESGMDLAALGDSLAAREEQLQSQLQQQLNLGASRPGGLASVGEHAELESSTSPPTSNYANSRLGGGSGGATSSRFAGNAAFQSAIARHGGGNNNNTGAPSAAQNQQQPARSISQDLRNLSHQRQISLQNRFADLGYNTSAAGGLSFDYDDNLTDDSGSVNEFMGTGGFDPTRRSQTQPHRRGASELPGISNPYGHQSSQGPRHGHGAAASMSGGFMTPDLVAEQSHALQQQIELLQMQQEQLLQGNVNFNPSVQLGGHAQADRFSQNPNNLAGHRRIQSLAPQPGGAGANFNFGGIGSIGTTSSSNINLNPLGATGFMGGNTSPTSTRAHSRRHSVNVVKADGSQDMSGLMQPNPAFSFPNTASLQNQNQQQSGLGSLQGQTSSHRPGHFSHPSVQLSSALSPEYLMAGGGLLNLSTLGLGGDLADGFGGSMVGGGRGGAPGHGRTGSVSRRINGGPGGPPAVADLASAQAQLASLHQFRSQAGTGHNKTGSFGGGFNPAMMGQQPGLNQFGGGFQQGGNAASQRKALFGSYLPQASLPPLLAAGKIVVGQIRVDKRNRSDAYVSTEVLDSDIYISGSRDRNRALSGDIVAVELLDPQEVWLNKKAKEDKKKHKEEHGVISRKPDKAKDDLEVEGAQLKLIDEEEDTEQAPPALAGHVVAIVERTPGQLFCGTIGLLRPSSAATKEKQQAERAMRGGDDSYRQQDEPPRPKIVWHRPLNKTTPLIAIPADQAPTAFWEEGGQEKYATIMVTVAIKRWPITSLHPFGTLIEEIGVMGNVEAETQAILKDNLSTATEDFAESALKCIPPLPFSIPDREYEVRRDFRDVCTFTIDPASAKDLDDALSVTRLDGGLYEVGVHIADVSHFVKMNSALDREARKRCTSVYLVQRAIPMLPHTLSEELCSLVPGVERLCFSVVFTMNKEARVIGSWYGRTIIKSCAKLAYNDAQQVIEGGSLPEGKVNNDQQPTKTVEETIHLLDGLARKMKARRYADGALKIDNVKLSFKLDEEGMPIDANAAQGREANELIAEFMLAANVAVSQRIAAGLPESGILRRHEKPLDRRLEGFQRRAKQMGFEIDISTAGSLFDSFSKISDPKSRFALEVLATKSMQRAKYFCAGMTDIAKYQHYALNVPVYTHFTSPIRRYADVMVHRQLDAILQGHDKFPIDREGMAKIAQQCNVKRDAAKLAGEQSQHLFLCLLLHDLTVRYGPVVRQATVVGVLDAAFDIVVPEFGIEKRVHLDQIPIEHHTYDEDVNTLSMYWRKGVDTIAWLAENSDDAHLKALRERAQEKEEASADTKRQEDEAALFDDSTTTEPDSSSPAATSIQRGKSRKFRDEDLVFEGLQEPASGHKIQTIKMLQTVPVVISASIGTKSPPVITVFAINPVGRR